MKCSRQERHFANQVDLGYNSSFVDDQVQQKTVVAKMEIKLIHAEMNFEFGNRTEECGRADLKFLFVFVVGCSPLRWKQ